MQNAFYYLLLLLQFDRIIDLILRTRTKVKLLRYRRITGARIHFVSQGGYELHISGNVSKLELHPTSHLKSDSFIECSGGVKIGRHFHVGRGLTIFSSMHDYKNSEMIPYDDKVQLAPVVIGDFVWCGANVTLLPGVCIGEGAILGAGAVVTKNVPPCAVVGGNPARIIGVRDIEKFEVLKSSKKFY